MIRFETIDVSLPDLDFDLVRDWIVAMAAGCGYGVGELFYYFCSDEALLDINQRRLGHDFYTDIVTFPLVESDDTVSSEFCISIDRIAENCVNFGRSFECELLRVIIHGVLHLVGFDDQTDADRAKMREKEEECLNYYYK